MEWGGYIIKKNIFPWIWLRIVYFQRVCGDFLCARSLSPSPSSSFTVSAFSLPADRSAQCNNTKYLSICLLVEWMTFLNKNHRINWGHLFSLYSSFSFKRAHLLWLVYTAMYTDYGFYFFWLNWELLLTFKVRGFFWIYRIQRGRFSGRCSRPATWPFAFVIISSLFLTLKIC